MKRVSAATTLVWRGASKWFTGIVTTCAALLAVLVNARNLGLTPWLGRVGLNFADHATSRILLTPRADTLVSLGDTTMLSATVIDARGAALLGATVRWRSSDSSIATVDSSGLVVARRPGRVSIEARVLEVSAGAPVLVRQRPASVVLESDSALRLPDGDSIRLLAHALDARGEAIAGQAPRWETADSQVVRVDSAGVAHAQSPGRAYLWAVVGEARVRLRLDVDLSPAAVVLQSGEGQRAVAGKPLPAPILLQVRARGGQPVPGVAVTLTPEDDQGRIEPSSGTTDPEGRIRAEWTLSPHAGVQRLLARVKGVDSLLVVSAEADPSAGNLRVEVAGPEGSGRVLTELPAPIRVHLTDTTGVVLGLVRLAWSTTDGSVAGATRTDSAGNAQAYWTLGRKAGRQRLLLQVGNPRLTPATVILALAEPGTPRSLVLEGGAGQKGVAGSALAAPVVLVVRDSAGNPVSDVALVVRPAGGSLADSTVTTGADGRARLTWSLGPAVGTQHLRIQLPGNKAAVEVSAASRAGPAAAVTLMSRPADRPRGTVRVTATVTDRLGNPVPNAQLQLGAQGGSLKPVTLKSDSTGRALALWTPATGKGVPGKVTAHLVGSRVGASLELKPVVTP